MKNVPKLGIGIGLRDVHFPEIVSNKPNIDWFEIISEKFMMAGDLGLNKLDWILERYPVVMHGVSLSIGSSDPLDFDYLKKLKALADRVRARWGSDHLCWTGVAGRTA